MRNRDRLISRIPLSNITSHFLTNVRYITPLYPEPSYSIFYKPQQGTLFRDILVYKLPTIESLMKRETFYVPYYIAGHVVKALQTSMLGKLERGEIEGVYGDYNFYKWHKNIVGSTQEYTEITIPYISQSNLDRIQSNIIRYGTVDTFIRKNFIKTSLDGYILGYVGRQLSFEVPKEKIYKIGGGMIVDSEYDILVSMMNEVIYNPTYKEYPIYFSGRKKLIVHPKVFIDKTPVNKYILTKMIPYLSLHDIEVEIKILDYFLPKRKHPINKDINDSVYEMLEANKQEFLNTMQNVRFN